MRQFFCTFNLKITGNIKIGDDVVVEKTGCFGKKKKKSKNEDKKKKGKEK